MNTNASPAIVDLPVGAQQQKTAGNYGGANLGELADRYAALETLVVGCNWPEEDMGALIDAQSRLGRFIAVAPCIDASDTAAKARVLGLRVVNDAEHSTMPETAIELAGQLAAL